MSEKLSESTFEIACIELLEEQGYEYVYACEPNPEDPDPDRERYTDTILKARLKSAIDRLNPNVPDSAREQALKEVLNLSLPDLTAANEAFHTYLTNGVEVEYLHQGNMRGDKVWLLDFSNSENNEFLVVNQFTVEANNRQKRPDIILFINGIPLVVIELKNPGDENATTQKAFTQLSNYKTAVPSLFYGNALLVISDGFQAKAGTISADYSRFMAWKTVDGKELVDEKTPQMSTLIQGMLRKDVLLNLIRNFIVFESSKSEDRETGHTIIKSIKKVAAYHQYYAVQKAVESAKIAASESGDRRGGVIWHTQGSGKSLSMVFFTGRIVQELDNPTVVVLTDRNDLDDQLFDTFTNSKRLLRQEPIQASDRTNLQELLAVASGGVVFTTIHKFAPEVGEDKYPCLSERRNIVVIADEAHRSQYGFRAREVIERDEHGNEIGAKTVYGFAKHLRDALPNATYLGFTGTPVEAEDKSTPAVFGDYIDIYDITRAVDDGATVKIFYESRLAKVSIKEGGKEEIDEEVASITEDEESSATQKAKAKWTRVEAIIGHRERIASVAKDFVEHFENRQQVLNGKVMFVAMSRRIAVELYEEIRKLRPDWHDSDLDKGRMKVVMTSSSSDPAEWQLHHTTKTQRKDLALRVKDLNDPLNVVIVRDMWLTGFDAPCLHTLYVDKPMQGHNLMQAIARVNRIFPGKEGGLIVDYIGIASDLKKATNTYTRGGGKGKPTLPIDEAIQLMLEKHEICCQFFHEFDFKKYHLADTMKKLEIILEAQDIVLSLENGKDRFLQQVMALTKAHAICTPHPKANAIKEDVSFFRAVKARLQKFTPKGTGKSDEEIETAIRQIVDKAVVSDGIIDIFDAAGIKKPDISILSDDFLEEIKGMKHKNLALELLKKLLNDEIQIQSRQNKVKGKKLSEMLDAALKKYQNKLLTATEIINEIIEIAKEVREASLRGERLNLSIDELAFYDALCENQSAREVMEDEALRDIARVLVEKVRNNAKLDWHVRENAKAKLRTIIKRFLRSVGYPPDAQKMAIDLILAQAEQRAGVWG